MSAASVRQLLPRVLRATAAAVLVAVLAGGGCGKSRLGGGTADEDDGAGCVEDVDCPDGSLCHVTGVCVEACTADAECARNEVCQLGRCTRTVTNDCEFPCPTNMQCVSGRCLWECQQPLDCPGGFACQSGFCNTGGCAEHSECSDDEACIQGSCEQADCRENADCGEEAVCAQGECRTLGSCVTDAHCRGSQTCEDGVCEGGAGAGGASGTGSGGGTACETNRDCGPKQYCISGTCRLSIECTTHAHCGAGEGCFKNLCWVL
jgi:hypothetical protein